MRFNFCDMCGKALARGENIFKIYDTRDKYHKYHYKYWNICDECLEEFEIRRNNVIDELYPIATNADDDN